MNKGWIKLDRGIQDHWIWEDHEKAFAWMDLLLLAEWETHKKLIHGQLKTFERGSVYMSIEQLASRWGWERRRVMRFLDMLESDEMCTQKRTRNGTTISLINYEKYQVVGTTDGTTDGTTNGTSDSTTDGTTDGTHLKNIKNIKKGKKEDPDAWWKYPSGEQA